MATNGGCRCLHRVTEDGKLERIRQNIYAMREENRALRAKLKAAREVLHDARKYGFGFDIFDLWLTNKLKQVLTTLDATEVEKGQEP